MTRYGSFTTDTSEAWGVLSDDGETVTELTAHAPSIRTALLEGDLAALPADGPEHAIHDVVLLPVLPDAPRIFCIGVNYHAHRKEMGHGEGLYPTVFARFASSVVGAGAPLELPAASDQFDYEGELALVIGTAGREISQSAALAHVAGYACFNDGSIRDFQRHTTQFIPGKNFDRSGSFGPWLVSADEVGDPAALTLETRLNGEVVQQTTTDLMINSVPQIIEYVSTFTELQPGDVIATGTPGGVGAKRQPPLWMRAGDTVEVEISGVGLLSNPVVQA